MSKAARDIGFVPLDYSDAWIGGRYYLHHLVRSVAALSEDERISIADVNWCSRPERDPFAEVRPLLSRSVTLSLPKSHISRLKRKLRRTLNGWADARDLFLDAGIGALFPISPCDKPGIPYVFWLTDFQYKILPELFTNEMRQYYSTYFGQNIRDSKLVVVSSQNAFDNFAEFYPDSLEKARILRFCSVPEESWWELDPNSVAESKGISAPYLIVCNQFSHHKNHETILAAMNLCAQKGVDMQLVCTGSTYGFRGGDYFKKLVQYIRSHKLKSRVHVLGVLPRAEQMALVRGSSAVLQPSRFEGWSTIIEDAKSLGKLVLASNIAVHVEQLEGECGVLLPVDDVNVWAEAMVSAAQKSEPHVRGSTREAAAARANVASVRTGRVFLSIMRDAMG